LLSEYTVLDVLNYITVYCWLVDKNVSTVVTGTTASAHLALGSPVSTDVGVAVMSAS